MPITIPELGKRIRTARLGVKTLDKRGRERPMTHEMLAGLVGTSKTTLIAWEGGNREPGYIDMVRVAAVTGLPLDWFAGPAQADDPPLIEASLPDDLREALTAHRESLQRVLVDLDRALGFA